MSVDYASIFPIQVTRQDGQARKLRDIASLSVTVARENTPVHPMAQDGQATGFTRGTLKVTYEMETSVPLAGLEIDWFEMLRSSEQSLAQIEFAGAGGAGVRFQLVNMVVDEINPSTNADGNAVARIRGKATDFRPDKANAI